MRRVLLCAVLAACRPTATEVPSETEAPRPGAADPQADEAFARAVDDLGPLLTALRDEHDVPSLAAAVVDDKGLLAIGAYGLRRIDEEGSVTFDDKYHLGSNTKALTATIAARLVDRGELRWDLTLGEAWGGDHVHARWRDVTLTDLLRHRAGVPVDANAFVALAALDGSKPTDEHRAVVTSTVLAAKPLHPPGSKYLYSNLGYVVVGAVLERATGKPWETLMRDEVFEPLGMTSCGFGPPATGDARAQPWGHQLDGEHYRPSDADNPAYYGPAATVHCSLGDYAKFAQAHFTGSEHVSPQSLAVLHEAIPMEDGQGAYAMGWGVPQTQAVPGPVFAHDGSNGLNYASILLLPDRKVALVAACNGGGERAQRAIVQTILTLFGRYVLDQKSELTRR
jgi:CubicO group peptidase (beta-lactamase class C family)